MMNHVHKVKNLLQCYKVTNAFTSQYWYDHFDVMCYLVTSLALSINTEVLTGLGPSKALLEPLHGAPGHSDRHHHGHQEHQVGGHQGGGVVGARALAVQKSQT